MDKASVGTDTAFTVKPSTPQKSTSLPRDATQG
jgi:hypothetical protein